MSENKFHSLFSAELDAAREFGPDLPPPSLAEFFPIPLSPSDRQRAAQMYGWSLNRGDRLTCAALVALSRHDGALSELLWQMHLKWKATQPDTAEISDEEFERALAECENDEIINEAFEQFAPLPERPILVSDVAAKVQSDLAQGLVSVSETDRSALQKLRAAARPLPGKATPKAIGKLLGELGVGASRAFEDTFREAAQFLGLGRGHNRAVLAATRRQSAEKPNATPVPLPDAQTDAAEIMESNQD